MYSKGESSKIKGKKKKSFKILPRASPTNVPKSQTNYISTVQSNGPGIKTEPKGLPRIDKRQKGLYKNDSNVPMQSQIKEEADTKPDIQRSNTILSVIGIPLFQKYDEMIIGKEMFWFEKIPNIPKTELTFKSSEVSKLKALGEKLWDNERSLQQTKFNSDRSSDASWLRTVMKSGTLSDKVAAFTMLLQESPVHSTKSLDTLMAMAKKKGRREALMAIDSLRHMWVTSLLPDRKLKYFNQWPLSSLKDFVKDGGKIAQDRLLILIVFEDFLKAKYIEFVDILEKHLQDSLSNIRNKMLGIVYELLAMKPEEEKRLLKLLVNKVGDPDRKVASRGSFLLTELVAKHPNMKFVVAEEVERLLFRKNISEKAQYYGICFLNQLIFSAKEKLLATKLIGIFFAFFKIYASKAKAQSKMLSALLTGVNRAFPFAKDEDEKYEEQLNMLFRVSHVSKYGTSIQALMLLFQVMDVRQSVSDRFYQTLYEKILNTEPKSASKQAMFLNLLFKSMKSDPSVNRVKAFVKRLFQSCSYEQQSYVCGVLYLLSELLKERPDVKSLLLQPEEEDDEEHFIDVKTEDDEDIKDNDSSVDVVEEKKGQSIISTTQNYATFVSGDVRTHSYQINTRNPLYCGAQFSCAWEASSLLKHFHPTVQRFSGTMLQDSHIHYEGDPLQDFTLMRFLDRFIYKNPKQRQKAHGRSIMQPHTPSSRLKEAPVNSAAFRDKEEESVREDELFFYRYFQRKNMLEEKRKGKKKKKSLEMTKLEENDDVDDEEAMVDFDFASEIKKVKAQSTKVKKKKKENDSESDSDSDVDEGDFGEQEEGSEAEFDYDDLEFSDEDTEMAKGSEGGSGKWTDKDYEKALLENLTSEDEEANNEQPIKRKRKAYAKSDTSLFAAADEFAHLLEEVQSYGKKSKTTMWEASRESNQKGRGLRSKKPGNRARQRFKGEGKRKYGNKIKGHKFEK